MNLQRGMRPLLWSCLMVSTAHAQSSSRTDAVSTHSDPRVSTSTPIPPSDASADQLREWKARHIKADGFVEALADEQRVLFYDSASLRRLGNGHVTGYFRSELVRPRTAHGRSLRSDVKKLEIDCKTPRYRVLEIKGFADSNMRNEVRLGPVSPRWTKALTPKDSAAQALLQACAQVRSTSSQVSLKS